MLIHEALLEAVQAHDTAADTCTVPVSPVTGTLALRGEMV
jgi:hypothetical protein